MFYLPVGFTSKKDRRRFFDVLFHQSASGHCSSRFRLSLEKKIARRFLCCPHSPICFLTLFFQMTVQLLWTLKLIMK
ncbi:hypothetical protein L1987_07341 [Smallanthus sonchifolius]|uniref:Uncharacterized protein n=1 Tax=Smallanthus sonchifolius TaxID=185202 RepID=A0ACB9K0L0_9ASTR|nr:hypothetical protein L1987_07341 [Smallanthus sonchifolius]